MAVNQTKRSIKRAFLDYGQLLEPIGIVILIAIFVVPILTVINLSTRVDPMIAQNKNNDSNVLGAKNDINDYEVRLVPGSHSVINPYDINKVDENISVTTLKLNPYKAATYSRPVLEAVNNTRHDKTLTITLGEYNGDGELSLIANGEKLPLYNKYGPQIVELKVPSDSLFELFLEVSNDQSVNFESFVTLTSVFAD